MSKIKAWKLTVTWDDGTENDVSNDMPLGMISAVEQFCDYWEETQGEESEDE